MRSAVCVVAVALAALGTGLAAGGEQAAPQAARAPAPAPGELRVLPVRGNIYLLAGGGSNITASVGKDGVLVVDTGSAAMTEKVLAALRDLSRRVTASARPMQSCVGVVQGCEWWSSSEFLPTTAAPRAPRPISGIINTSDDPDHVAGNAAIANAGRSFGVRNLLNTLPPAWVLAHENVTGRLTRSGQNALVASETYFGREKKLNFFNGEGVVVTYHPAAHTDGDSMVYFRGSDVLVAGDILNMTAYPVIDPGRGGTIQGVVDALNWILDVAVVEHMMEGGTMIIPGHGRITDAADVAYYRDMMTIFRDRIQHLKEKGMTLEQIKAARPTRDYDARFGKSPASTPGMLVEAIYETLGSR
jgi:glyoxylase-like metal-dependent hydrolase (beta-lactamase superfamily II)